MSYVPIMAQYIEPGMNSILGEEIHNVTDLGECIRVQFISGNEIDYTPEQPLLIAIDLEQAA